MERHKSRQWRSLLQTGISLPATIVPRSRALNSDRANLHERVRSVERSRYVALRRCPIDDDALTNPVAGVKIFSAQNGKSVAFISSHRSIFVVDVLLVIARRWIDNETET
jgi:hypothetical protein